MFGTGVYAADRKGKEGARQLGTSAGKGRGEGSEEGACAQGEELLKDRIGKRLLAARAARAAFGADPRGVATLPVATLRVSTI